MIHTTLPQLCAYLDGELGEASAEPVRRHLSVCPECTGRFGELEAVDEFLAGVLCDDPGEEFFRILGASISADQPKQGERVLTSLAANPRRQRAGRRAEDRRRGGLGARASWIAAGVICVAAGSAAWVAFDPIATVPEAPPSGVGDGGASGAPPTGEVPPDRERGTDPLDSAMPEPAPETETNHVSSTEASGESGMTAFSGSGEPPREGTHAPTAEKTLPARPATPTPNPDRERLVERAPRNFIPVRTIITESVVQPGAAPTAPASSPLPGGEPDPAVAVVREATKASLEAARTRLPDSFDRAAEAWESALPLLETGPETLALARRELAQSRFQAWAAEPTPARREAAISSTRQYLLYAPPGPERDQAWTWLGRLKH